MRAREIRMNNLVFIQSGRSGKSLHFSTSGEMFFFVYIIFFLLILVMMQRKFPEMLNHAEEFLLVARVPDIPSTAVSFNFDLSSQQYFRVH